MKEFEGYNALNPQEKNFLVCLEAVSDQSVWGLAISNVMKAPTAVKIRQLIGDLKSQEADQPDIMLSILGQSCYDQLQTL
jgi:hypothetical protein